MTAPGHVLLVDDEPAFQRLGGAWLRGLGHTVTVAGSAEEAVTRFRDGRPDLVLLDLSMPPRMDPLAGIELIAAFLPVPVVVLTRHAGHDMALRATEAGAWDFIAKPIEPDMLRFVVDRALRKAALEREVRVLREQAATDDLGLVGRSEAIERTLVAKSPAMRRERRSATCGWVRWAGPRTRLRCGRG